MQLEVGMIVRRQDPLSGESFDRKAKVLYIDKEKNEALIEWLPLNGMEVKPYVPVNELRIIIGADNKDFFDGRDVTEAQNKLRDLLAEMKHNDVQKSACQAIHDLLPLVEYLPVSAPVSNLLGSALISVLEELGVCK